MQAAKTISEQEADKRLKDLLHHFEGAKGRWHRMQRFGASDEVLKEAIAFEIGIFSGSTRPGEIDICGKGGKSPRVWIGCSMRSRPTLSGKRLIGRVRSLMQIPYPTRLESHAGFCAGQAVWVLGRPDELPGQRPIQTWVNGVVEDFEGDRLRVAVAQRKRKRGRRQMERYDALLKPEEVFAELPDWSGFLPFVEHIQIIERSLLRELNKLMQQADSAEQHAILEDQELALIDEVSHWARSKGWRLIGKNGHWRCCPLRRQSRKFTPMLQPGDEAIADPLDFRQVYVRRDGRFINPPKPVQLNLFEGF